MVHPTKTPGFVRRLLRSLSAFEFGSAPSALLLQVWFWSFTPQELALDDAGVLLASAIRRRQIDSFDSLREHCTNNNNNFPLVVTSDMVDAASRIGVPVLDRLWQLHCDQLHLPPIKFPSTATATAIDGARDVDTLDWWWQKHTQLGLPFKSVAAVHHAFTGRTARQVVQHIPTPIARSKLPTNIDDRPMQLAICQWWRDRATKNGLCSPSRQCTGTLGETGTARRTVMRMTTRLTVDCAPSISRIWLCLALKVVLICSRHRLPWQTVNSCRLSR